MTTNMHSLPKRKASLNHLFIWQLEEMLAEMPVVAGKRRIDILAEMLSVSRSTLLKLMRGETVMRAVTYWVQAKLTEYSQVTE